MNRSAKNEIIGDLTQNFPFSEVRKMLNEGVFTAYEVNEYISDLFKDIYIDNYGIIINIINDRGLYFLGAMIKNINQYIEDNINFEEQAEELFYHIENTDYYIRRV